ncbi:subtilisin-like protease sbt4.3 [Quercus suber]|uniref:Subtilisin-like protease sbt4.3 n=1 Tax=Quercus suber TaxID=58331 RepID=A0AAW0JHL1_QUESU
MIMQVYIVYMGSLPTGQYSPLSKHFSLLQEVVEAVCRNSLLRSYKRSFNGFAAKLTDLERQKLASKKEVVSVFPSKTYHLHTTRSWDFIGLSGTVERNAAAESNVIVGFIDTGIWPESESFNDEGFGPPPKKWKGESRSLELDITQHQMKVRLQGRYRSWKPYCLNGSRQQSKGCQFLWNCSRYCKRGVPSARIAAYKACYPDGCEDASILAAFDDAIADGVDIISISLGSNLPDADFSHDAVAIGAFHAMEKGILTSQSAGNSGPDKATVASIAPWILSVAASSTDRQIIDKGIGINGFSLNGTTFPLVDGKNVVASECSDSSVGCLNSTLVKGKIVLCNKPQGDDGASSAGAVGSILKNEPFEYDASIFLLPASSLSADRHDIVASYINSTKEPQATILKSEAVKDRNAPKLLHILHVGEYLCTRNIEA